MIELVEAEQAFRVAMSEWGLLPPSEIVADDRIHRCNADRRHGKNDGWYVFHADGVPAGAFGDWADGRGSQSWCSRHASELSAAERAAYRIHMQSAKKARDDLQQQIYAEKAELAAWIWRSAPPISTHAYLSRKGVKSYGLRLGRDGRLIVPAYDADGRISTLEFIAGDGSKRFLKGARKVGCWFTIGEPTETICIAEGYATGATIHEATGYQAAVAFDTGGLLRVSQAIRANRPDARIVLCADDDAATDGNPGLSAAKLAAHAVRGFLAVPRFAEERA
jgi:putative DNA primase/helicase